MTGKEAKYVSACIENESFDYAFHDYSDFVDKVQDAEFHRLRLAYLEARRQLAKYIGEDE
jgi:hypothetical protein